MRTKSSIKKLILDLPPSCIEFSPEDPQYLVVGAYFLERSATTEDDHTDEEQNDKKTKPQQRSGSLMLLRLDGDEIRHLQTHPTSSAILDLHFCPQNPSILCTATSTGALDFYKLSATTSDAHPRISLLTSCRITTSDTLTLSFSFHQSLPIFSATLSTGEVVVGRHNIRGVKEAPSAIEITPSPLQTVLEHSLEAWTSAISFDGYGILSGGDDCIFQYRALTVSHDPDTVISEDYAGVTATWSNRKFHMAGVTAILPLSVGFVVTGSYDDHIRIISIVQRPRVLAELNLGGGVWRLKLIETRGKADHREWIVLASCMHAGARIVSVRHDVDGVWEIEVLTTFEEHKSMNYGSDVQPIPDPDRHEEQAKQRVIVSTSFYDKLLCLWKWKGDTETEPEDLQ